MQRTVGDWLENARTATDQADQDRCLDVAAAQATSSFELRSVLRTLVLLEHPDPTRLSTIANRLVAEAITQGEIWGFRDVATARSVQLADPIGARAALEAGFATFAGRTTPGYVWGLLADGFVETLSDLEGARHCLAAGVDAARMAGDVDGLCSMATTMAGIAGMADRKVAADLVAEAEAALGGAVQGAWTVATAWSAVGEQDAAARLLTVAIARCAGTSDAVYVARALHHHAGVAAVGRAIDRGRDLAVNAIDWIAIAEAAFDLQGDEPAVRAALNRAAELAPDALTRSRVAGALRQWLGDAAAAAQVGSAGVRPDALRLDRGRLAGWELSANRLFDWLRDRVSPEILDRIAGADYGDDHDKHLAALLDIWTTGLLPLELGWHPGEVLRLGRWAAGERVDHLERAWCCTILWFLPGSHEQEDTAPGLIASCLALGGQAPALAEQMFAWHCSSDQAGEVDPEEEDEGANPVALVSLLLLRAAADPGDPRVGQLHRMLVDHPWCGPSILIDMIATSITGLWAGLIDDILVPARAEHPAVDQVLRYLGY